MQVWQKIETLRRSAIDWFLRQNQVRLLWSSGIFAALIALILFWLLIDPAPPGSMRIATGSAGGFYERLGRSVAKRVEHAGVKIELIRSKGSVDNIGRLTGKTPVDVAFVQGGVDTNSQGQKARKGALSTIASIAIEPLWLFTKNSEIQSLSDLRDRRIAAGPHGSGTRDLLVDILKLAKLIDHVDLVPLSGAAAVAALKKQEVDVAAFVTAPDAKWVRQLVATSEVKLVSLKEASALARILPFATTITLPAGILDLAALKPSAEVQLVAVSTNMVVQDSLHPALKSLLLQTVSQLAEGNRLLGLQTAFPNGKFADYPLNEQAERYFTKGPSVVRNYLPYWAANLVERFWILIIPLLTLILPVMRVGPMLYTWGMRRRIYRWYTDLAELERDIAFGNLGRSRSKDLERLAAIEDQVRNIQVPAAYRDDQYRLRLHIDFIKRRLDSSDGAATQ